MAERKEKVFYHLYGNIVFRRGEEIEVQKVFANKEDVEAEIETLETRHGYGSNPKLTRFDIKYETRSLQGLFGIYTVEEICEVDEDFRRMIDININDLSRTRD
ncbi:TPA: hypothetical protein QC364_000694 [Bacillus cereus]|nr:hypothetical protein [Bacillus cereus]